MRNWVVLALCMGLPGCGAGPDGSVEGDENIASVREQIWIGWGTNSQMDIGKIVGISRASQQMKPYAWDSTGFVCRGLAWGTDVCGETRYPYSAPGAFTSIVAVATANGSNHVYAWYSDSKVSQGTSDNLSAFNGKVTFSRPTKPGGGQFAMTDLIEADVSGNGQVYYYWKLGSKVYRTTGTSNNGGINSGAAQVTVSPDDGDIVGISFGGIDVDTGARPVETWYADGWYNQSTSSLNLAQ